jgi:hypothetical protein
MDRLLIVVTVTAAWILWQELLFLDQPGPPSWYLESRFSLESACQEARQVRLIEQLLRADNGGPTVLNRPTIEDGTIWLQLPDGLRAKMRFICLPEVIDPGEQWFGHRNLAPSLPASGLF